MADSILIGQTRNDVTVNYTGIIEGTLQVNKIKGDLCYVGVEYYSKLATPYITIYKKNWRYIY